MKHQQIFKAVAVLFFACFLASCVAPPPTASEISNAYYGRDMSTSECQAIAEEHVKYFLIDPQSAQFRHHLCGKGNSHSFAFTTPDRVKFGWIQLTYVNGKNSFGGYAGFRPYVFIIRDGHVVDRCRFEPGGGGCTRF